MSTEDPRPVEPTGNPRVDVLIDAMVCPSCRTIYNAAKAKCDDLWHSDNRPAAEGAAKAGLTVAPTLGWDEYGHAVKTGLPIDRHLGRGDLQDAENCGYAPVSILAEIGVDATFGDPQIQFRDGRITLTNGTVLERGGTLNCVWAVTRLPRYTEADVDRLAEVIHDARTRGIWHGNYTLARWILDHWKSGDAT